MGSNELLHNLSLWAPHGSARRGYYSYHHAVVQRRIRGRAGKACVPGGDTTLPAVVCVSRVHICTQAQPALTHSPLPAHGHLEPHSPFSFSPNMVRKTVKLMGPGASFTMDSSSSFFTLRRPGEERGTPRSTGRVRADPGAGSPGE